MRNMPPKEAVTAYRETGGGGVEEGVISLLRPRHSEGEGGLLVFLLLR
jgi:hypothetical protein